MKTGQLTALVAVVSGVPSRAVLAPIDSTADELLDTLVWVDGVQSRAAAAKIVLVEQLRQRLAHGASDPTSRSLDERAFTAEIAAALTLSERAAENLIGVSRALVQSLPATLTALASGEISYRHAQIMVEQTVGLDADSLATLEAKVLPAASTSTPPRFASTVRKQRERLNPESIEERHVVALDERTVVIDEDRDGMVWVSARTSAANGLAIHDRLTTAALAMRKRGDKRTLAQLRADIFVTILLARSHKVSGKHGATVPAFDDLLDLSGDVNNTDIYNTDNFVRWFRGITAEVIVSVPALSLLGHGTEPATLEGYGPIDLDTARILAGRARSFVRILTHPETGATLSVGRKRYKVPKDLRMWLRVRDGTCRFPNCNRQAKRCDVDHSFEWHELGETAHDNLAHLCRSHHTLKSAGKWKVEQASDGSGDLTWSSPAGRSYTTRPAMQLAAR
ncbi:MAG: hypothetical protein QOH77_847 [Actinomycetota bacterium]|nr:hypothetical protein [Actinomycetota bacterium]